MCSSVLEFLVLILVSVMFGTDPRGGPEGLKVGYMCFDYNDHPTAHLIEGLFLWHARLHKKVQALEGEREGW